MLGFRVYGFRAQRTKTRTPRAVPLKVPLNTPIMALVLPCGSLTGAPETQGNNLDMGIAKCTFLALVRPKP